MATLIIQENGAARTRSAVNGEEITVAAPCNCTEVTGVQIAGVLYPFYDACGNNVSNIAGKFSEGSLIRVLIDTTNTRAQIINQASTPIRNETKALFGLGADAVPDDIFSYLGNYSQHWWEVYSDLSYWETNKGEYAEILLFSTSDKNTQYTFQYSSNVAVSADGTLGLANPVSNFAVTFNNYDVSTLRGKYVKVNNTIYYVSPSSDQKKVSGSPYKAYISSAAIVTAVPVPGGETTYVHSVDRNAYPDSGEVDGMEYTYLGIPFDNAITAPKIATGSYVGTGTYGESNKSSLTFDFKPKIVLFYGSGAGVLTKGNDVPFILLWGVTYRAGYSNDTANFSYFDYSGNVLNWYSQGAGGQFNASATTYYYVAIG